MTLSTTTICSEQKEAFENIGLRIGGTVLEDINLELALNLITRRFTRGTWTSFEYYKDLQKLINTEENSQILCLKNGGERVFFYYQPRTQYICLLKTYDQQEHNKHKVLSYHRVLGPRVSAARNHHLLSDKGSPFPLLALSDHSAMQKTSSTRDKLSPLFDYCIDFAGSAVKNIQLLEKILENFSSIRDSSPDSETIETATTYIEMTFWHISLQCHKIQWRNDNTLEFDVCNKPLFIKIRYQDANLLIPKIVRYGFLLFPQSQPSQVVCYQFLLWSWVFTPHQNALCDSLDMFRSFEPLLEEVSKLSLVVSQELLLAQLSMLDPDTTPHSCFWILVKLARHPRQHSILRALVHSGRSKLTTHICQYYKTQPDLFETLFVNILNSLPIQERADHIESLHNKLDQNTIGRLLELLGEGDKYFMLTHILESYIRKAKTLQSFHQSSWPMLVLPQPQQEHNDSIYREKYQALIQPEMAPSTATHDEVANLHTSQKKNKVLMLLPITMEEVLSWVPKIKQALQKLKSTPPAVRMTGNVKKLQTYKKLTSKKGKADDIEQQVLVYGSFAQEMFYIFNREEDHIFFKIRQRIKNLFDNTVDPFKDEKARLSLLSLLLTCVQLGQHHQFGECIREISFLSLLGMSSVHQKLPSFWVSFWGKLFYPKTKLSATQQKHLQGEVLLVACSANYAPFIFMLLDLGFTLSENTRSRLRSFPISPFSSLSHEHFNIPLLYHWILILYSKKELSKHLDRIIGCMRIYEQDVDLNTLCFLASHCGSESLLSFCFQQNPDLVPVTTLKKTFTKHPEHYPHESTLYISLWDTLCLTEKSSKKKVKMLPESKKIHMAGPSPNPFSIYAKLQNPNPSLSNTSHMVEQAESLSLLLSNKGNKALKKVQKYIERNDTIVGSYEGLDADASSYIEIESQDIDELLNTLGETAKTTRARFKKFVEMIYSDFPDTGFDSLSGMLNQALDNLEGLDRSLQNFLEEGLGTSLNVEENTPLHKKNKPPHQEKVLKLACPIIYLDIITHNNSSPLLSEWMERGSLYGYNNCDISIRGSCLTSLSPIWFCLYFNNNDLLKIFLDQSSNTHAHFKSWLSWCLSFECPSQLLFECYEEKFGRKVFTEDLESFHFYSFPTTRACLDYLSILKDYSPEQALTLILELDAPDRSVETGFENLVIWLTCLLELVSKQPPIHSNALETLYHAQLLPLSEQLSTEVDDSSTHCNHMIFELKMLLETNRASLSGKTADDILEPGASSTSKLVSPQSLFGAPSLSEAVEASRDNQLT